MNSIASYEDNNKYYISAGVMYDNVLGDKMYWFDKEASLNVSASCYQKYRTPAILSPNFPLGNYIYTPIPIYTSTFTGPYGDVNGIYWSLPCSN